MLVLMPPLPSAAAMNPTAATNGMGGPKAITDLGPAGVPTASAAGGWNKEGFELETCFRLLQYIASVEVQIRIYLLTQALLQC